MFACLFCDGDLVRLAILRRAYILAALIATAAGYIGFFHLVPGAGIFLDNDRVSATFKDPNVYGPFLIFPSSGSWSASWCAASGSSTSRC